MASDAAPSCPLPPGDPLCAVNDAFHDAYAARRAAVLAASGPVLLQLADRLVLVRGGERLEALTTNARYHQLKSVAHVPFAVFLMLAPGDDPIGEARIRELEVYRAKVRRAAATIGDRFADAAQRDRQRRILGATPRGSLRFHRPGQRGRVRGPRSVVPQHQ